MPLPNKGRTLDPTEAAWLAGLIDGDGTVALPRRHKNEHRHLEVSISNTDFALLEYVKSIVWGRPNYSQALDRQESHTKWCLSNQQSPSIDSAPANTSLSQNIQIKAGKTSGGELRETNAKEWSLYQQFIG